MLKDWHNEARTMPILPKVEKKRSTLMRIQSTIIGERLVTTLRRVLPVPHVLAGVTRRRAGLMINTRFTVGEHFLLVSSPFLVPFLRGFLLVSRPFRFIPERFLRGVNSPVSELKRQVSHLLSETGPRSRGSGP